MDNLTHSLVGALMAKAGLGRAVQAPHTTLLCVVAANAPDLDIVTGLVSPALYLTYHRHLTHSLFAIPAMAAVSVVLARWLYAGWLRVRGRPRMGAASFGAEWLAAVLVGATHPLLDWTNTYGTRHWLPFSDAWSYGDLLFIIDLVVWAVLLASTAAAWRLPRWAGRISVVGLLALVSYIASNEVWRVRALAFAESRVYDGARAVEVGAFPAPGGPLDWIAYARTEEAQYLTPVQAWSLAQNGKQVRLGSPGEPAAVEAAKASDLGQAYEELARYPIQRVVREGDRTAVTLADVRFYRGERAVFSCLITLDDAMRVVSEEFGF